MTTPFLAQLSDPELLDATLGAARDERHATARLLQLLAEVDTRRLYLGEGYASLFTFCTQRLRLSEHAAYHRIEAARAARQFPVILELLARGDMTLTTVAMLRPHLTEANHGSVLKVARHKTKREVEHQIACLAPRPDARALLRRVTNPTRAEVTACPPTNSTADSKAPPPAQVGEASTFPTALSVAPATPRPAVAPLSPDRYLLRVTLKAEAHAKLRRAQDLLRHSVPNGDPAEILDRALTMLVRELERVKVAKTTRPKVARTTNSPQASVGRQAASRHIPAGVRRAVWSRDRGRCAFEGPCGRCTETGRLEFHHLLPFACGGAATIDNIALRCRAHNNYEGERQFGRRTQSARSGPS